MRGFTTALTVIALAFAVGAASAQDAAESEEATQPKTQVPAETSSEKAQAKAAAEAPKPTSLEDLLDFVVGALRYPGDDIVCAGERELRAIGLDQARRHPGRVAGRRGARGRSRQPVRDDRRQRGVAAASSQRERAGERAKVQRETALMAHPCLNRRAAPYA